MPQSDVPRDGPEWPLDGNASEVLHEIFDAEMTTAVGTCQNCRARGPAALEPR